MCFGDDFTCSQVSNQSDYLRDIDLPELQGFDLDILDETGTGEPVKCEPLTPPVDDVLNDMMMNAVQDDFDSTVIQPSPEGTIEESSMEPVLVLDLNAAVFHIPDNGGYLQMVGVEEPVTVDLIQASDNWIPLSPDQTQVILPETQTELATCKNVEDISGEIPYADSTTDVKIGSVKSIAINYNVSAKRNSAKTNRGSTSHDDLFTDEYLRTVSTKSFNRRIQEIGLPAAETKRLKAKRRTLKNRGYAQSCRQKRVGQHQQIDAENSRLRQLLAEERARHREDLAKLQRMVQLNQQLRARNAALEEAVANSCLG